MNGVNFFASHGKITYLEWSLPKRLFWLILNT